MPDFSRRDTTAELMDTEETSFEDFRECLKQLTAANRLSLAYRPTRAFFKRLLRNGAFQDLQNITVLDAAAGYGDMTREIAAWARTHNLPMHFIGVDMNPWSARAASEVTPPDLPITWVTANLVEYSPTEPIDIVMSSLFTHHLPNAHLVRFVTWMEQTARLGWYINDLKRHPLPYYALKAGFWLTRRHRFMRHDGPVSVASAFVPEDWERILAEAGVPRDEVRLERWSPYRLCVAREKAL